MKVRILNGTNQIGGCVTEITSDKGTKIIIDYGENLNGSEQIEVEGLTDIENKELEYDAVFITHSHGDHIGNVYKIKDGIKIYIEKTGSEIHDVLCDFTREFGKKIRAYENPNIINFEFKENELNAEPIPVNDDIIVTPYIADHSSYNSSMFLIEVDGKRILHTGDFRNHGKKGVLFKPALNKIGKVDLLITEGTTFSRSKKMFKKEIELKGEIEEVTENYDQVYFMCSSTNIDRIVSIYNATKKSHIFIEDLCMNSVTQLIPNIPTSNKASFKDVYTYVSKAYQKKYEDGDKAVKNHYNRSHRKITEIPFGKRFAMSIKASMKKDLEENKDKIKNACLIYSMWDGYIKDDYEEKSTREFVDYLESLDITFYNIHTSGHADEEAMNTLNDMTNPEKVIIIHTDDKNNAQEIGKKIFKDKLLNVEDNEFIEI